MSCSRTLYRGCSGLGMPTASHFDLIGVDMLSKVRVLLELMSVWPVSLKTFCSVGVEVCAKRNSDIWQGMFKCMKAN